MPRHLSICTLALLGACQHAEAVPSSSDGPAELAQAGQAEHAAARLSEACDETAVCAADLVCHTPCIDWSDTDECIAASTGVCVSERPLRELEPAEFMAVLVADRPYAILGPAADGRDLLANARVLAVSTDYFVAGVPAPVELVAEPMRQLTERQFAVMGAAGRLCTAEPDGWFVLGLEPDVAERPMPKPGVAIDDTRLEYARLNGAVYLGLALRGDAACMTGLWARDAALPEPPSAPAHAATQAQHRLGEQLVRDSVLGQIHSERYAASGLAAPHHAWTEFRGGEGFEPQWGPSSFTITLGADRQLIVSAHVGHPCDGYVGSLLLSYHVDDESLTLGASSFTFAVQPRLGLDLDGDGELELLAHDGREASLWSSTLSTRSQFAPAAASSGC